MRLALLLLLCACARNATGAADFEALMGRIADGWNRNDARQAADCFATDAVYEEPPGKQLYRGREGLFGFFGGNEATPPKMSMTWHHLVFDEKRQIGAGEYTFEGNRRYHGIVIVRLRDGRVDRWREYQAQSDMKWEDFVTATRF